MIDHITGVVGFEIGVRARCYWNLLGSFLSGRVYRTTYYGTADSRVARIGSYDEPSNSKWGLKKGIGLERLCDKIHVKIACNVL
jgi:hypothetical protein